MWGSSYLIRVPSMGLYGATVKKPDSNNYLVRWEVLENSYRIRIIKIVYFM